MSKNNNFFSKLSLPLSGVIALSSVIAFQAYAEESFLVRGLVLFGGILLSIAIALLSSSGRNFLSFFKESIVEAKKVIWPTRKETIQTVLVVFVFVVIVSAFLWLADKFYEWFLYSIILGWK
jgi:preprotein translocase subunit SecE